VTPEGAAATSQGRPVLGRQPYRPDIDGLRAIAILLVVGYHIGLPGFGGGFIGVDVFFVLSGFLITGLLVREVRESGRISFLDFYARRIRRLLPALALVVVVTLLLGVLVLLPWELEGTAKSATATGAFVSNIYFWRVTHGYFGEVPETQPLLHTWSLAVEEQFYLVWPILIGFGYWFGRRRPKDVLRWITTVLAITCLASFLLSVAIAGPMPFVNFFLMPPRLWELGAGGLLALSVPYLQRHPRRFGALWVIGGLGVIVATNLIVTSAGPWPGLPALAPVLATVAVVLGGSNSEPNGASGLLGLSPIVSVGRLSYSWYLWHWPLLVLVRLATLEQSLWRDSIIALAALGLAALTYQFVEQPIRRRRFNVVRTPGLTLMVGGMLVGTMLVGGITAARLADRLAATDQYERYAEALSPPNSHHCTVPEVLCVRARNAHAGTVALLGDSMAGAWSESLAQATTSIGMGLRVGTYGGCPFVSEIGLWNDQTHRPKSSSCAARVEDWLGFVQDPDNGITIVVIANVSLPGRRIAEPTEITSVMDGDRRLPMDDALEAWESGLRHTISAITSRGIRVIVLQTAPGLAKPAPDCVPRKGIAECGVKREIIDRYRDPVVQAERRAVEGDALASVWDPEPLFCTDDICLPEDDGVVYYWDAYHPSQAKTVSAAPVIAQLLEGAP